MGTSEGLTPVFYTKTPTAREEERCLLYVGITRVWNLLDVSWTKSKEWDSCSANIRTKPLEGIQPKESTRQSTPAHARVPTKEAARHFEENACAETLTPSESLKAWRKKIAALAGRPPYAVFTDQILRDIVLSQPDSYGEPLAVRGIGEVKAEMFREVVLTLVRGEDIEVGLNQEFAPEEGFLTDPSLQVPGPRRYRIRILTRARRSRHFSNHR